MQSFNFQADDRPAGGGGSSICSIRGGFPIKWHKFFTTVMQSIGKKYWKITIRTFIFFNISAHLHRYFGTSSPRISTHFASIEYGVHRYDIALDFQAKYVWQVRHVLDQANHVLAWPHCKYENFPIFLKYSLRQAGATLNHMSACGTTPLHVAVERCQKQTIAAKCSRTDVVVITGLLNWV